ncbi:MAG: hypothetical protein JRG93_13875 [Deltaproteobacteria bacterium]|nr:hypothetical protein [Deltaproteobacteria bacterium]
MLLEEEEGCWAMQRHSLYLLSRQFRFREDGSVSVWTRIESEHLPNRVSYELEYHRAP